MVVVPLEKIPSEPLLQLLEEFVTRDGTDYGVTEVTTDEKVRQVTRQLQQRKAFVVFDEATESLNIVTAEALREAGEPLPGESEGEE